MTSDRSAKWRRQDRYSRLGYDALTGAVAAVLFSTGMGVIALAAAQETSVSARDEGPRLGSAAPDFTLTEAALPKSPGASPATSSLRRLSSFRGRPVILLFFCGCETCAEVAKEWGSLQRGGALAVQAGPLKDSRRVGEKTAAPAAPLPRTVIVYQGEVDEARSLAIAAGLDPAQTVVLLDPDIRVAEGLYHASPCPRAFVIDAGGVIRYAPPAVDSAGQEPAPVAAALTAGVLSNLRRLPRPLSQ